MTPTIVLTYGLDFLFLLYGLSNLLAAGVACSLRGRDPSLPWGVLALALLLLGAREWVLLLGFGSLDSPWRLLARWLILPVELAGLEFGRRALFPGRLRGIALLLLGILPPALWGLLGGVPGGAAFLWYGPCLLSLSLTLWVLLRRIREAPAASLGLSVAVAGVLGQASTLILAPFPGFLALVGGQDPDAFRTVAGLPVQLYRCAFSLLTTYGIWRYALALRPVRPSSSEGERGRRIPSLLRQALLPLLLAGTLSAGWGFARTAEELREAQLRETRQTWASLLARELREEIPQMESAPGGEPLEGALRRIEGALEAVSGLIPGERVVLFRLRGGRGVPLVSVGETGRPLAPEAREAAGTRFLQGGIVRDLSRGGTVWLSPTSVIVPVFEGGGRPARAALELSGSPGRRVEALLEARLPPLLATQPPALLLLLGFVLFERRRERQEGGRVPRAYRYLETGLVAVVGVALSLVLALWTAERARGQYREAFRQLAESHAERLREILLDVDTDMGTLTRAFSERLPDARTFRALASPSLSPGGAIRAISWAAREDYGRPPTLSALLAPAPVGGAFLLRFVEPAPEGRSLEGTDVAAEPFRRKAIGEAFRTGLPTATAPVRLALGRGERGIAVFYPVRRSGTPAGVLIASLPGKDLLREEGESPSSRRGLRLALLDLGGGRDFLPVATLSDEAPGREGDCAGCPLDRAVPLPKRLSSLAEGCPLGPRIRGMEAVFPLLLFGRAYALRCEPSADFFRAYPTLLPEIVLLAGCLLTALLAGLVRNLQTGKDRAEELARRRTEEYLRAKEVAEAATEAKSRFLAVMSHEIRTPLNAVVAMTEVLLDSDLSPEQRHGAEIVRTSAEGLMILLNDILDLSKVEAGKLELEEIPFAPAEVLEEVRRVLSFVGGRKGLRVEVSAAPGLPPRVIGDPGRLRQILLNLGGNAVKFTERGAVEIDVRTEEPAEGEVLLSFQVRDSGMGIPEAALPRLFLPFSQVDVSTTRRFGGSGLGLAISADLVKRMGGTIGVENRPEGGALFRFQVRFRRVPEDGAAPGGAEAPELGGDSPAASGGGEVLAAPEAEGPPPPETSGPRATSVLLVEDHPVNREVALILLSRLGVRADTAENGREALEALRKTPYGLVLMDVQMPEMDGLEAARAIRDPRSGCLRPDVPIVAMTADALKGDRERCLAAGMDDHLPKPIRTEELRAILSRFLGGAERPAEPGASGADSRPGPVVPLSSDDGGTGEEGRRPSGTEPSSPQDWNRARLWDIAGDEEMARSVMERFLTEAPGRIGTLRARLREGDLPEAIRIAHGLKGLAGTVGAEAIAESARRLILAARRGDSETALREAEALAPLLERVRGLFLGSTDPAG
jgi:signal transduction histidine kinase/CheY-like chemotaxis protein/HPt (histidine-containing phosphotransfer) domain-containing protein